MKNITIGCHLSISNGFEGMAKTALDLNANTFQFFTRNPRGGKAKNFSENDIQNYRRIAGDNNFGKIVAHASYTLNLCSANPQIRAFSKGIFADDLAKLEDIPGNYYNFHPGSHTGQGVEIGISQIADALNFAVKENCQTEILLETMAGKGSEIGGTFEEICEIINQVNCKEKIGVCLDTCHIFDGGYDIVNDLNGVLEKFDEIIGIEKLKVIHLNDSKNSLGSHKDRHEKIGQGFIGLPTFQRIVSHPELKDLIFILETPQDYVENYRKEIEMLKN